MKRLVGVAVLSACSSARAPAPDIEVDAPVAADSAPRTPALWVLTHDGMDNWLYRVDPTTFAIEHDYRLGGAVGLWELAGTGDHIAYAIDRDQDLLVTIDLDTGSIGSSVKLGGDMQMNGRGFGVTADGTLLGDFAGMLKQIDPATGALSHPMSLEFGAWTESLESCGGQLYSAARESGSPRGERLYRVSSSTGKASLVAQIGTTAIDVDTLACNIDGRLLGVDSDPVLGRTVIEIDPATAKSTTRAELAVAGTINGLHVTMPAVR
jgi:hypothetical protein